MFIRCLIATIVAIGITSCNDEPPVGEANTNGSANVKFGDPNSDATLIPCQGKGICMLTTAKGGGAEVAVDFELATPDGGQNTLTFTFNINDLFTVDSPAAYEFVSITEDGQMHAHPQYTFASDYHMVDRALCDELDIQDLTISAGAHNNNTLDNATGIITVTCDNVAVTPKHE